MALIGQYLPNGDSSPYRVGRRLCELSAEAPAQYSYIRFNDKGTYLQNASEVNLFHLTVTPWIGFRPYWNWLFYFRKRRIPIVVNIHGDIRGEFLVSLEDGFYSLSLMQLPTAIFSKKVLGYANHVIVNSKMMMNLVNEGYGVSKERIHVIPNGIDIIESLINERPMEQHDDSRPFRIFTHGGLSTRKGLFELISAIDELNNRKIKLEMSGNGPLLPLLERMVKERGLQNNISFLGHISENDLYSKIREADLCIYPSKFDGFNIAALEALAYSSAPVFISNKAGIVEFLPEKITRNCFSPTKDSISSAIQRAMAISDSDNRELTALQKETVKTLTWGEVWKRYLRCYDTILDG